MSCVLVAQAASRQAEMDVQPLLGLSLSLSKGFFSYAKWKHGSTRVSKRDRTAR